MTLPIAAAILAGGRSSRMGRDKALLPWNGQPLVVSLAQRLQPAVEKVFVIAAPSQSLPSNLADYATILRDDRPGEGPLPALLQAVVATREGGFSECFVTACDHPALRPGIAYELLDAMGDFEWDAVVPVIGGSAQPLPVLLSDCNQRTIVTLSRLVDSGERRLWRFYEQVTTQLLDVEAFRRVDRDLRSFEDADTPEEYADLVRRFSSTAEA